MCISVERNLIHIPNEYHSFATDKISCINTDFPVILEPEMGQWMRKQKVVYKANKSL